MQRDEIRRQIDAILNKHDAAFRALREVRESKASRDIDMSMGAALSGMRTALEGLTSANEALVGLFERHGAILEGHGRAIDAALEANQAALALLRQIGGNGHS